MISACSFSMSSILFLIINLLALYVAIRIKQQCLAAKGRKKRKTTQNICFVIFAWMILDKKVVPNRNSPEPTEWLGMREYPHSFYIAGYIFNLIITQ
jgi:hypothetical protein